MTFAWPLLLWLLLVPATLLVWELTHRRRATGTVHPKILQAEAGAHSLKLSSFNEVAATARKARPRIWFCCGLMLAIVALARPQWGRLEEPVFDQSREILLAIDLSRSMLTPDVRPSRLDRAKLLIQSLLERLAGERVGLVVFSGTAFLQSPLSADYEILREFLPALGPDYLPQGGSNYTALIDAAVQAFGSSASADRFLVVLSDGEATDDEWKSRVEQLEEKGIRVIGLGVGTATGAMIPDGAGGFIKDERGAVVMSKLESATLQELARATNGVYRDASTWVDLAELVKETIETGRKGEFVETRTVRYVERFQWPLALGLWCLLVSFYYEFPVRPRVRDLKLAAARVPPPKAAATRTAAALVALLLACVGAGWPLGSFAAATLATPPAPVPSASAAEAPAPPEPPALAKIVGRLSAAETQSARDWVELGRETVLWGSRLQSEQQAVPEGPVRDALAAVELGSKLDARATDWPKLREELEALLKKPEEPQQKDEQKPEQPPNQEQDQPQKQDQQQQQKDSSSQDQKQADKQPEQKDERPKQDSSQDQNSKPPEQPQKQGESAFGDMNQNRPPPPPPGDTQKVGGAPEKKEEQKEPPDPALALPLQKLDRLRSQDSPAQLFQLMEGDKKPPQKKGKDW